MHKNSLTNIVHRQLSTERISVAFELDECRNNEIILLMAHSLGQNETCKNDILFLFLCSVGVIVWLSMVNIFIAVDAEK